MRVLVAPDTFKGTLTALEAAGAIASGWRRGRPDDTVEVVPLADGGEGTLDVILSSRGGRRRARRVHGPLGEWTIAEYGLTPADDGAEALVEISRASGLSLVPEDRRDPLHATTRGTGELIRAACAEADRVLVCLGGSATNDAGAGMAQALGFRLLDASERDLEPGGAALRGLAAIDATGVEPRVRDVRFLGACDVDNPLSGPDGASVVYGPQKGAGPDDVELLDRALGRFADVVRRDLGVDVRGIPGAGAAGGLGAALVAFLGADLRPGIDVVMEAVGFQERLEATDLVITGEGSFDAQSLRGKVPGQVAQRALEAGKEVTILCGRAEVGLDGALVASLVERFGESRAVADPAGSLHDLAAALAVNRGGR